MNINQIINRKSPILNLEAQIPQLYCEPDAPLNGLFYYRRPQFTKSRLVRRE
jgi:hypothetical protein